MKNPIKRVSRGIRSTWWLALLLPLFILSTTGFGQSNNSARNGVLDLRNLNWNDGIQDLNGDWEFYWKELYTPSALQSNKSKQKKFVTVPGFWNDAIPSLGFMQPAFGYATYKLAILCPSSSPPLALKFLTVASNYKLFINGSFIAEVGKVATNPESSMASFQPAIYPVTPIHDTLEMVIQVSNYTYNTGGVWDFIKLGSANNIHNYEVQTIARDYFIAGSFFLIGLFYLVIYFFFRRSPSPIYFSFFCILVGLRSLVTGELDINFIMPLSWQITKHIEYASLYLIVPVLALFSYELFPREFSKRVLRSILIISVPFIAISILATPFLFRYTLRPFQVFMLISAFYGFYVYVKAVRKKRVGSLYFLIGFVFLLVTGINDILYTSLLINSTNLIYIGLYILIICQAAALSKQFFGAFHKVEKLNAELEHINLQLNEKNETINKTNEQLNHLHAELDTLVFRTTHDLRSPITSVFAIADLIKIEKDEEKRNKYLDFQKRTLLRLNNLINEILEYAKNKNTDLQYEAVEMEDFVNHTLLDHSFSHNSENIQRVVEVHQPCLFVTDKNRLGMVLGNLISNALKHHNKTAVLPFVKVAVSITKTEATIVVSDNGQGIAENHINHIFTKFYKINSNQTGSGFGLYIVKETVEKLGGTIEVQSIFHEGTKFTIVLPNYADKMQ